MAWVTAEARVQSMGQELPPATGAAERKKEEKKLKKKKNRENLGYCLRETFYSSRTWPGTESIAKGGLYKMAWIPSLAWEILHAVGGREKM